MRAAFSGWTMPMVIKKVTQVVLPTGFVEDHETVFNIRGIWQPLSAEEIQLKPEGQRSWEWFQLHIEGTNNNFQTNDRLMFRGNPYKVMGRNDYTLNNYIQLELISDYIGEV